jgi:MoaD family protein
MTQIKVYFLSTLADITGEEEMVLNVIRDLTVKALLKKLARIYGKKFEHAIMASKNNLNQYILIGINGRDIKTINDLSSIIQDGDEIAFLPAIAGG